MFMTICLTVQMAIKRGFTDASYTDGDWYGVILASKCSIHNRGEQDTINEFPTGHIRHLGDHS